MSEWIISSCVVVLTVLCLRRLFYHRMSPCVRYGLWVIVLFRLLLPFQIGQSVLSAAQLDRMLPRASTAAENFVGDILSGNALKFRYSNIVPGVISQSYSDGFISVSPTRTVLAAGDVLFVIWLVGMLFAAGGMLYANVRFYLRLKRSRIRVETALTSVPVYCAAVVTSPCLFGFPVSAIYLRGTEEAAALPHILAHETAHKKQGDAWWSILRCVCLILHWYNPLVWAAVLLSKRDSEGAADALAVRQLGEGERYAYGRTLLSLALAPATPRAKRGGRRQLTELFSMASDAVSDTQSRISERITLLVKCTRTKRLVLGALCVCTVMTALVGFSGIRTELLPRDTDAPEIVREAALSYAEEIFNGYDDGIRLAMETLEETAADMQIRMNADTAYKKYRLTDHKIMALTYVGTYDAPVAGRRLSLWYMEYAYYADGQRGWRFRISCGTESDGSGWVTEKNRYYLCFDVDTGAFVTSYENISGAVPWDGEDFWGDFCHRIRYYESYTSRINRVRTIGGQQLSRICDIASGTAVDPYCYVGDICYRVEFVSETDSCFGKEQLWRVLVNETDETVGCARYYPEYNDISIVEDIK